MLENYLPKTSFKSSRAHWVNTGCLMAPNHNDNSKPVLIYYRFELQQCIPMNFKVQAFSLKKYLPKTVLSFHQFDFHECISMNFIWSSSIFIGRKCIWKCHLQCGGHFVQATTGCNHLNGLSLWDAYCPLWARCILLNTFFNVLLQRYWWPRKTTMIIHNEICIEFSVK